ncbi:P-loop containing nucleoside triphosphate hydrolase protein [Podospora didyma]|uniref:ATP-dependent RNA helicase ROK1 n=1 Tax=Podospora didyma TaxID=330526 RepID=A0AAE0P5T5_9PEZI|nr:P-loop containing nucleoside triphosphate hydrolase protein [Podospora didyma]
MDILKLLSRGTKPNPKKNAQAASATQLPSAGSAPNPQLYHDDVGDSRGKKRKRRGQAQGDDEVHDEDDLSDVDYFAPKAAPGTESHSASSAPAKPEPPKRKVKLLDEDECRQVFRSHRLKLTVLSGRTEKEAPKLSKKAKKDKKDKAAEGDAKDKKDDKKQQFFPQPLNAFSELRNIYGVNPELVDNMTRQGFRVPTEVQIASLPLLLHPEMALKRTTDVADVDITRGIDFLAAAPTGSGKTISFLIPAIDGILRRRGEGFTDHVLEALIVAPTRELASQIVNEGRKLALGTGVRVVLMKKTLRLGAEEGEEIKPDSDAKADSDNESEADDAVAEESAEEDEEPDAEPAADKEAGPKLPAKVDILVTTPKILLNFLAATKTRGKKTLPTVRSLILDEADVLLDQIFQRQIMGIWRACTNPDLSLTCWSATIASSVEAIIEQQLRKRARRTAAPSRPLVRLVVGLKDTAVPNITHKLIYTASEQGKLLGLRQLLHPVSSADSGPALRPPFIVFTQTIERAQALHDELKYDIPLEAGGSARVAVLHSNLADSARSKIMTRFRAGEVWVLITTDVLARGVDFAGVNGVVNYDVPTSAAAYVHRVGRTGRAGRAGGVAVTYYTKDDIPFVKSVANVIAMSEKQAGQKDGEASTVQKWLLDALPKVKKEDKRKLKTRGVESRRTGGKATITTTSAWQRQKDNNKRGAIEGSKRRKKAEQQKASADGGASDGEWGGLD